MGICKSHPGIAAPLALAALTLARTTAAADTQTSALAQCSERLRAAVGQEILIESDPLHPAGDYRGEIELTALIPGSGDVAARAFCTDEGRGHVHLTIMWPPIMPNGWLRAE